MLPVDAPMQLNLSGICTLIVKSCSLAWESPKEPGMLLDTFNGVNVVTALLVSSRSHSNGPAPSALTWRDCQLEKGRFTRHTYLMDSHGHHGARRNLGHPTGSQLSFGLFANVNVTVDLSAPTRVNDVLCNLIVADDGGILLTWGDRGAVAGDVRVN